MNSRKGIELRKRPDEGYIAFIGNYVPWQCGIATFTTDLCEAVAEEATGADFRVTARRGRAWWRPAGAGSHAP
jgi:hypothetical protein